jgi:hypothetical protein
MPRRKYGIQTDQKDPRRLVRAPNLTNYPHTYSEFSWEQILHELDDLPMEVGLISPMKPLTGIPKGPSGISWPCVGLAKTGK